MSCRRLSSSRRPAHPRWRGAHELKNIIIWPNPGSSPLARGTCLMPFNKQIGPRLIPAGAGHIIWLLLFVNAIRAHPRWRGAHVPLALRILVSDGSSPLARGTSSYVACDIAGSRLIPAGAGHMSGESCLAMVFPAHPRWRGAHPSLIVIWVKFTGSSPLARGTSSSLPVFRLRSRLIPAGAGHMEPAGR